MQCSAGVARVSAHSRLASIPPLRNSSPFEKPLLLSHQVRIDLEFERISTMGISTVISLTAGFMKYAGEIIADLKRQELARIDIEMLNLKRTQLSERLEEFNSESEIAIKKKKAQEEQSLISRGLFNSTVRDSTLRAIENDANNEVAKATREYNRTMEEIALMERKITEKAQPWWKKVFRSIGLGRV
jgi:hypothetical protein